MCMKVLPQIENLIMILDTFDGLLAIDLIQVTLQKTKHGFFMTVLMKIGTNSTLFKINSKNRTKKLLVKVEVHFNASIGMMLIQPL